MVNFPTQIPDCDSNSPALLDLFLSPKASICSTIAFPPLVNSDHVDVSVSIHFPTNSKQDAPFHCIAYDYSVLKTSKIIPIYIRCLKLECSNHRPTSLLSSISKICWLIYNRLYGFIEKNNSYIHLNLISNRNMQLFMLLLI